MQSGWWTIEKHVVKKSGHEGRLILQELAKRLFIELNLCGS